MRREAAAYRLLVRWWSEGSQTPEHPAEADQAIVEGGRAHQDAAAAQLELPALLGREGFDHALDLGRRDRLALGVAAPGVVDHAAAAKRSAAGTAATGTAANSAGSRSAGSSSCAAAAS